jgi:hypothetical protein
MSSAAAQARLIDEILDTDGRYVIAFSPWLAEYLPPG